MAIDQDEPGPVFDEEFIRGAAYTEPSAKERARKPRKPKKDPAAPRSGRSAVFQVFAAVVVLLVISTGLWWVNRPDPVQPGTRLGNPPVASGKDRVNPQLPFAGSPAADYAEGDKGLVMPDPKAVGTVGHADMATAFDRVKTMLVAANLDPRTVQKNDVEPFLAATDADQRASLRKKLRQGGKGGLREWLTSFAPGVTPVGTVVKVNGKVTTEVEKGRRRALVRTDHLFVFAVRPSGPTSEIMRVIVRRTNQILVWRENGRLRVWQRYSRVEPAPADCDAPADGLIHPDPDGDGRQGGTPVDPYDLSKQRPDSDNTCGRVTRV